MRGFWISILILGIITVTVTVLILFVPSLWISTGYTKSDRLALLQSVYGFLSLVLTVIAVWFVVNEFSEKQKRANIDLDFENTWIFLGTRKESSRIQIMNEGQISASHFVVEFILDGFYDTKAKKETITTEFIPYHDETKVLPEVTVVFSDPFAYNRVANIPKIHPPPDPTGHLGYRIFIVFPANLVCQPDSGIPIGELKFSLNDKVSATRRKTVDLLIHYQIYAEGIKTVRGKVDYKFDFKLPQSKKHITP